MSPQRRTKRPTRQAKRISPRVGCSGWNYKSWRGTFYPDGLDQKRWLEFYTTRFDTVEVNNTFYRLPERSTFVAWRSQIPARFVMAIKASRFLTHMKRLRDPAEPIERLFSRVEPLGNRLGPVLYQLPANFTIDLNRLDAFLEALPRTLNRLRVSHVMEFRHPSWYVAETFQLLNARRIALCLHDKLDSTITEPFVGPLVYVRFHGTSGRYHGSYSSAQLDKWAHRLAEQSQEGRPVFAYFNNDPEGVATVNATTLRVSMEGLL
jgi:uncharacterized protein YecE (DUF72 family)